MEQVLLNTLIDRDSRPGLLSGKSGAKAIYYYALDIVDFVSKLINRTGQQGTHDISVIKDGLVKWGNSGRY